MNDEPTIATLKQELSDALDRLDNAESGLMSARIENDRLTKAYQQCDSRLKDALVTLQETRRLLHGR